MSCPQHAYFLRADQHGIPSPHLQALNAQELRRRWSPEFDGLSVRVRNALAAADVTTLDELVVLHAEMLLFTLPGLGMKCYSEVTMWLDANTWQPAFRNWEYAP